MKEKVLEILQDVRPDIEFEEENMLVDDSILESLDMVVILSRLEDAFGIEIEPENIVAANFNSVDAICNMLERIKK